LKERIAYIFWIEAIKQHSACLLVLAGLLFGLLFEPEDETGLAACFCWFLSLLAFIS
jgi:hypothetical protein